MGGSIDRHRFKQVKHLVQSKIKAAYNNYIQNILSLNEGGDGNIEKNQDLFFKKKKTLLSDRIHRGVSPLKDSSINTTSYLNREKQISLTDDSSPSSPNDQL